MPLMTWLSLEVQGGLQPIETGECQNINPRTDTSIVNTDIGMRLYSFLTNFEMFSYFRSLNCFDFRDWIRGKLLVPKRECFYCHTVTISGRSDESKLLQSGQMNSGLWVDVDLMTFCCWSSWRVFQEFRCGGLYIFPTFEVNRSSIKYVCSFLVFDEWQRLQKGLAVLFHLARLAEVGSCWCTLFDEIV